MRGSQTSKLSLKNTKARVSQNNWLIVSLENILFPLSIKQDCMHTSLTCFCLMAVLVFDFLLAVLYRLFERDTRNEHKMLKTICGNIELFLMALPEE